MKKTVATWLSLFLIAHVYTQNEILVPFRMKNKWGYADTNRKTVIPCEYDFVFPFNNNGMAPAFQNKKWGFINKKGEIVLPFVFDRLIYGCYGYYCFRHNGCYIFVDDEGKISKEFKADTLYSFSEGIGIFELGGRLGYIDISGNELTPCVYEDARPFYYGYAKVAKNGKFGYIDENGKEVIPCCHDSIINTYTGYFIIKNNNVFGVLNSRNEQVVPSEYDDIEYDCVLDAFIIKKNGLVGMLKGKNKILNMEYNKIYVLPWNLIVVYKNGKAGLVDTLGEVLMPMEFDDINFALNGHVEFKIGNKKGLANNRGKILLPAEFDDIMMENDTCFFVLKNHKVYAFHKSKRRLYLLPYEDMGHFYGLDNMILVRKKGKYGLVDLNFRTVLPVIYEDISWLQDDVLLVKSKGKCGIIDIQGKIWVPFKYDDITDTPLNNYFIVEKGGLKGLIDISGKEIVECRYDEIEINKNLMEGFAYLVLKKTFLISEEEALPTHDSDSDEKHTDREITLIREMGYISDKHGVFFND
jgi:hypothetical protein